MTVEVFSDGASRGNPGVSAIVFMILSADGRLARALSEQAIVELDTSEVSMV